MRSKHWMLVFALVGLIQGAATQAQAKGIRGSRTVASPITVRGTTAESSITFLPGDLVMDGDMLGNPGYIGTINSDEATIEMNSNVGLTMSYTTGLDMASTKDELPTSFQFQLQGTGQIKVDNASSAVPFTSPGAYTAPGAIEVAPGQNGFIAFDPNLPGQISGFKSRVAVERSGLNDHFGEYSTQITLTWSTF